MLAKHKYLYLLLFIPSVIIGQNSDSVDIQINPIDILNTSANETNVCVSADRMKLYFMSTRGGQKWSNSNYTSIDNKVYGDGDLFLSEKLNGQWNKAINLGNSINTSKGEDEPICDLSGELYIFESWKNSWPSTNGPYYLVDELGQKRGLHKGLTQFFLKTGYRATDGSTISPDKKNFIFAAGPSLDSNMNLYYINLGDSDAIVEKLSVSTEHDERTPFIGIDRETFYFSSDGYGGFGGLDVFKTTWKESVFSPVLNLGKPINGKSNDYNFTIDATGSWAYMVKNRDIYEIDFRNANEQLKPKLENNDSDVIIYFDHDSDSVNNSEMIKLKLINKKDKILLFGSTDNLGTAKYNLILSKRRAYNVYRELIQVGVPKENITMIYLGESKADQFQVNPSDRKVIIKKY